MPAVTPEIRSEAPLADTAATTAANRRARRKTRLITIVVLLVVILIGWWWWNHHKNATKPAFGPQPSAVGVATVQRHDVPLSLAALGTVTSTYTVTVHSRVDGQLEKVHFQEGQLVKQGQLIAELDPRPYQAALTQAQGQLLRDQATLKNAQLDLVRYRQLQEQNSIAKQQVDTQESLVQQSQGTVKIDQGVVDNAKLQLEYSRVTAPITGRAGLRQVDPGNVVHASDTNGIVIITQTQPINVVFAIPEVSLSQVLAAYQQNNAMGVESWDRDNRNKLADGNLLAIDNQLNVATGTVNLKARFANDKLQLFPNQFVNVHLDLGTRAASITVPTVAVQLGKVGNYVYIVNADQTVSIAKVKIGPVSNDQTIIEQGLQPGQRVVIDGLDKLREGAKVQVIDRVAQNQAAANAQAAPAKGGRHRRDGGAADGVKPDGVKPDGAKPDSAKTPQPANSNQ